MATTIKITVKSIKGNPIKGLTVKAYTPKEKAGFGKAKKTNANGEVALDTTQKVDFGKDAIFFRVFEGNRLLKTSEKVIGNKNVVLKINPVKLSMLSLPEKEIDKLVDKEIKKELQLRLTDYLYGSIVVQLKDKDNKGLKVLKEQISKLVEEEKFKKGDRQLSTILKKTINSLKKNSRTKVLVEHVVVPEEKEKQSLESFLRLGEAVNKSSWFSDKLKKEAFEKAAGLPFVKADKKEDFKTALDKSLTRDDLIKELIDKEIVAKEYKSKLELWLDASSVLGDHQLIENILKDGTIKTARDLVMLRSKPQEVKRKIVGWEDLIDEDNDLPINGNREDYISLLEDRIAARYPYAFMMDRLVQGDFVDKKNKEQEKRVYKYFNTEKDKHKAVLEGFFNDFPDMDLQKTDLLKNTFYYSKKGGEWKKRKRNSKKINGEINKHLLAMQRIFSLAPTYPLAAAMLKAGFYAAADVSKVPMKELRKRMQAVGVNTEMAQQSIVRLKARAERSVSQTMYLLGNAHALFSNQYTSTNVDITNGVRQELQKELERIPGYEDHFGPQNYCKCAHCQSIFSPGAYFVDLMQYIKWAVEYNGNNNVLPLKARRNDLWEIAINCENAHKEIPYLEVVNEVLEKYAQGLITKGLEILKRNPPQGLKLANLNLYLSRLVADKNITLGNIKDTDVNIFRAIAYHETEAFSSFSLLQPTNLFLEASKLILGHFDLTLFDISEISDTVFDENKTRLYLGITKEEFATISKTGNLKNSNVRYGELLQNNKITVADFLKKTKLTRTELKYLLASQFIKGEDTLERLVEEIPNEVNKLNEFITGFSLGVANRFFRFSRLWKLLPWTIQELDLVLNSSLILKIYEEEKDAIRDPNIAPNDHLFSKSLQAIAKMAYIQQQLEVSVEELVGILSAIPSKKGVQIDQYTQQYTNLEFEQAAPSLLYRIFKPIQDDLDINETTDADALKIAINNYFKGFYHPVLGVRPGNDEDTVSEKAASLLGVLKISEADFSLLVAEFIKRDIGSINDKITDGKIDLELPLINLLYRYVKIADGLGVSISELLDLVRLVLDNLKITSIDDVIQLIREYKVIEELPFSLEELMYIVKGIPSQEMNIHTVNELKEFNSEFIAELPLLEINPDTLWEVFPEEIDDDNIEAITAAFEILIEKLITADLLFEISDNDKKFNFRTLEKINTEILTEVINNLEGVTVAIKDRFKAKSDEIQVILNSRKAPLFVFLAGFFNTTVEQVTVALHFIDENAITPTKIKDYSKKIIKQNLETLLAITEELKPCLLIFEKSGFSDDLISDLIARPKVFGMDKVAHNSNRLEHLKSLATIQRLQEYKIWIELTESTTYKLSNSLANFDQQNEEQQQQIATLLEITPQQLIEIKDKWLKSNIAIDDFQQLRKIAKKISLLGMSVSDFGLLTKSGYDNIKRANKAILNAFKSKYKTEGEWEEAYEPYQEKLQELKRNILVDYILNWRNHPTNRDDIYYKFKNTNDLYHYFLLDPEMSGCAQISKLKAATLSLQLYVQRVFLQLEKSEDGFYAQMDADLAPQWVWRKNYRIWEANRKVFLYPENYIEPEWRDNKSPQFEKLEEELMQEEVNADSVELAYKLYLESFTEVAKLKITGSYYNEDRSIYYFFGRTTTEPFIYYFREYNPKSQIRASNWTSWKKIEQPINAEWVTPHIFHGKIYLFWLERVKEEKELDNGKRITLKTCINYSSLTKRGSWDKPLKLNINESNSLKENHKFLLEKIYSEEEYKLLKQDRISKRLYPSSNGGDLIYWDLKVNDLPSDVNQDGVGYNIDDVASGSQSQGLRTPESTHEGYVFNLNISRNINSYKLLDYSVQRVQSKINLIDKNGSIGFVKQEKHPIFYRRIQSFTEQYLFRDDVNTPPYLVAPNYQNKNVDLRIIDNDARSLIFYYNNSAFLLSEELILMFKKIDNSTIYYTSTPSVYNVINLSTSVCLSFEDRYFKSQGLKEFLSTETQEIKEIVPDIITQNSFVLDIKNVSKDGLSYNGTYGTYFKELFFHIPFLIANHLNANQKFKEAKWWYERIFNPTATAESGTQGAEHFWEFLPFRKVAKAGVASLKSMLQNTQAIGAYEEEPFMPHMIARVRTDAYMKTIVMKYIDNLLDWGDQLFSRDSFESINEAMMLYILAQDILGDKPVELGACENVATKTYGDIESELKAGKEDDFLIYVENMLLPDEDNTIEESIGLSEDEMDQSAVTDIPPYLLLFCVPFNKEMLAYWNRVEDRLFKIRNCMNIKGQKRKLSLYEPPIDPRLLVAARASGLSLEDAIASVLGAGNLPHYRFNTILSKARDLVGTVQSFGSALLSALEKKDGEQLALLRSTHEQNILKLTKLVKKSQIEEARTQLANLRETKANVQLRVEYYEALIDEGLIWQERTQQISAHIGNIIKVAAGIADIAPVALHIAPKSIPTPGGDEAAQSAEAASKVIHSLSSISHAISNSAGMEAGNQRRKQEWKQQLKLAQQELKQVDQQILAAEIRIQINEQDLVVYEQQVEQAKELHDFYKNKLTKLGLYNYHATTLGRLFRHAYNMALDMAKQAERCYQFEVDDPTNYIIQNDNWDSSHYGFLAGERLLFQLQQLDKAYLEKNERRQEITQSFSLRQLDALALLKLKATGNSEGFTIPEWVFDMFYPGHYKRIIKSVRLTIPCVTGPYTNVPATLKLNSSQIRLKADWKDEPTARSYGKMQSISTSSANNDGGLFEFNFRDERYLPFEGAGAANSKWSLSLPSQYKPFDYNTISDVIIHISYTSKFDGIPVDDDYNDFVAQRISNEIGTKSLLISLQHDFPNEYTKLKNGADGTLEMGQTHFPYFAMGKTITITGIKYLGAENDDNLTDFVLAAEIVPISNNTPESKIEIKFEEWKAANKAVLILLEYTLS